MSEDFTIYTTTPPTELPHKARYLEILELPNYLKVRVGAASGTDRVLMDPAYKGEAGNAGRIYVERDENNNEIVALWSYAPTSPNAGVDGWARWKIADADMAYPPDGVTLKKDEDNVKLYARPLVDGTTLVWYKENTSDPESAEKLKATFSAESIPVGLGTVFTERSGVDELDVNVDGATIGYTSSVSGSAAIKVNDASIVGAKLGTKPLLYSTFSGTLNAATQVNASLSATGQVLVDTTVASGVDMRVGIAGWYRVSANITFTDVAVSNTTTVTFAITGADAGGASVTVPVASGSATGAVTLCGLIRVDSTTTGIHVSGTPAGALGGDMTIAGQVNLEYVGPAS